MKVIRVILIIISVTAGLAVMAFIIAILSINPAVLMEKMSAGLYASTGLQVKTGQARLHIFKGVEFDRAELSLPGGFKAGTALSISNGGLLYNPLALLTGSIDILRLEISGVRAGVEDLLSLSNLFTNKGGNARLKIRSAAVNDAVFSYQSNSYKVRASILMNDVFTESMVDGRIESDAFTARISGALKNAHIVLENFKLKALVKNALDIRIIKLETQLTESGTPGSPGLIFKEAVLVYSSYRIENQAPFQGSINLSNMEITASRAPLTLNGSGGLLLSGISIGLSPVKLTIEAAAGGLPLSALVKGLGGTASGNLLFTYGKSMSLNGSFIITNGAFFPASDISGRIGVNNSILSGGLHINLPGGKASIIMEGGSVWSMVYPVSVSIPSLDLDPLLKAYQRYTNTAPGGAMPFSVPFSINTAALSYGRYSLESVRVQGVYSSQGIKLDRSEAHIYQGKALLTGSWKNGVFTGNGSIQDLVLADLTRALLDPPRKLLGRVSANFTLNYSGGGLDGFNLSLYLKAKNGEIRDFIIQEKLSALLYDIPLDSIFFDSIEMNARMEKGLIRLNSLQFSSQSINASVSGGLTLQGLIMDLDARLSFTRDYLRPLPSFTRLFTAGMEKDGNIIFHLGLKGGLEKPQLELLKP